MAQPQLTNHYTDDQGTHWALCYGEIVQVRTVSLNGRPATEIIRGRWEDERMRSQIERLGKPEIIGG